MPLYQDHEHRSFAACNPHSAFAHDTCPTIAGQSQDKCKTGLAIHKPRNAAHKPRSFRDVSFRLRIPFLVLMCSAGSSDIYSDV